MRKVRIEIGAVVEVYIDADVTDEKAEEMATEIVLEQVKRLDETESGVHDPDLWLASYGSTVIECEEVNCK